MSKNTILNYFSRSPAVNKENTNKPCHSEEKCLTPQTPKSKVRGTEKSKLTCGNVQKTPSSQKKRSRNVSLEKFNSPSSNQTKTGNCIY